MPGSDIDKEKENISEQDAYESSSVLSQEEGRLVRRIDIRIVPASMLIYLLCFLDRSNIGNAKNLNDNVGDSLLQTLNITSGEYLTALMIFIVAYLLFETPWTYAMKSWKPSRTLALLMFSWGFLTIILGCVKNLGGLIAVRFLLGAFEAGLFPGLVYYLTFWYNPRERAVRIALILACATLAGAFGGAIAYGVGHMNGALGHPAWRYLFWIEGTPSCISALLVLFVLPDFPETASWLSESERELATSRLVGVASLSHSIITWAEARTTLLDWRLYLHYLVYISVSVPFSSISLFAPTIVEGLGYDGLNAQLFTVPPYAIAFVVTVVVAWVSDRYEGRAWGAFISLVLAGVSFIVEGALPATSFKARYGMLCMAVTWSFASIPPLLSWLTANLRSTSAATLAVPLNVSIGQFGQIIGVYIFKSSESPGYPTGHYTNAGFLLEGALVVLVLRWVYVRRNRALGPEDRLWSL